MSDYKKLEHLCDIFREIIMPVWKPKDWEMAHGKHPLKEWSAYQCYEDKIRDSKLRSKTFPGIAKAMATQWGGQA